MATKTAAEAETPKAQTALTWLACTALAGGLLYTAKAVLVPIALAVLLTFLLAPLVIRLQRQGVPKYAAVPLVAFFAAAVLGGLGWLVTAQLYALARELPKHQPGVEAKVERLKESWGKSDSGVFDNVRNLLRGVRAKLEESAEAGPATAAAPKAAVIPKYIASPATRSANAAAALARGESPQGVVEPVPVRLEPEETTTAEYFNAIVAPLVEPLATAGLIAVLVIFMLLTREDLRNRIVTLSGQAHLAVTTKAIDEAGQRIAKYLLMQFVINASYGVAVAAGTFALGVPYAALWGVAAAVLRYIPYVGPWVAAVLPLGYSVLTSAGWMQPLGVIALIAVLELLSNNVMEPWLYGRGIGVSPVAVILAAVFWGWLWGPVGLILATPLTVCLVVAGRYVPSLGIFTRLLGDESGIDPHAVYYQRLLAKDDDEAEELFDDHAAEHGLEEACTAVIVPALELAKRDRMRGLIDADEEEFILESVVEHLVETPTGPAPKAHHDLPPPDPDADLPVVFGYGMRDDVDQAALAVLGRLLAGAGCRFETLSRERLLSESFGLIRQQRAAGVVLLGLPPGGLVHAKALCKRFRSALPDLPIAVARWGGPLPEKRSAELRKEGVNYVSRLPAETCENVRSMLRLRAAAPPPAVEKSRAAMRTADPVALRGEDRPRD